MISILSLITIVTIFSGVTIGLLTLTMRLRIQRLNQTETHIANQIHALDTNRLQSHLKDITLSAVEIDAEVASLKHDIDVATQEHQPMVDDDSTRPDKSADVPPTEESKIRVLATPQERPARVS